MAYKDFFRTDEFRVMLSHFEKAEQDGRLASISSDDLTDIAEYFHAKGEHERALEIINEAAACYPGAVGPLVFLAREALMDGGKTDEARQYAEQIEDKTDLDYYYLMAEIMICEDHFEDADRYLLEKYNVIDEEDKQSYILDVAVIYADYELWPLAEAWANEYEDVEDDSFLELKARLLTVAGNYKASEEILNKLLDRDPFSTERWNMLAHVQLCDRRLDDCGTSCDYALAVNPDDLDALFNKAYVLFRRGNYKDSVICYSRYLRNNGEDVPDENTLRKQLDKLFSEQ